MDVHATEFDKFSIGKPTFKRLELSKSPRHFVSDDLNSAQDCLVQLRTTSSIGACDADGSTGTGIISRIVEHETRSLDGSIAHKSVHVFWKSFEPFRYSAGADPYLIHE
jgi:hypothetical protein